ncbi:16647_t:CDS:2 [Funneliformis geosporum]|uniref:site-specific DNA-methyltransferase (adenine-specific) n=1 Tax=Funneliformis geosporum TaxID=1117311 RepID=A0A9W4SBM1_9GLOM|nr:16647_t:CDS:2 [Funneliformis geosporum]
MSNLENFESEEEMKGFVLKALEIDPTKKQREFEFIQQGHSDSNPKTKKILERCGGKPEKCDLGCFKGEHHKGISQGRPEYIIRLKDKILIVELKLKSNKHESKKFDEPRSYNVDGALYYSKKQQPIYEPLGKKEKEILPWDKYFERLERKPNREIVKKVLKVAENLHNNLRNMSFDQDDKPFFISGCLIALKDKIFHSSLLKNEFDSETETLKHLKSALEREIEGEKYQHLVNELKEALENDSLTDEDAKKEDRLSSVLKVLQRDIFPLIHFSSNFDVIGEFYHEFLRYSGNDEGLGILLTPSHIAEIFTELVVLKPTDKVLDICCGTGTFLVVALSKMSENASPKTLEEAKKNLFGIEKQKKIYRLALTNMILRGDGKSNIIQGSCFKKENLEKLKENGGTDFKVGFLNPPYSQTKYPEGKFILHHLELLEKGGRMAVIVPLKLARGTKQKD